MVTINPAITAYTNRKYPFLRIKKKVSLKQYKYIFSDLKEIIPARICNFVYSSTDNIIISKVLGIATVAVYSNFLLIINSTFSLMHYIARAFRPALGAAVCSQESKNSVQAILEKYQFVQFLIANILSVGFYAVADEFIVKIFGGSFAIGRTIVLIMSMEFFFHSMCQPTTAFFDSAGLFKQDKIISITTALVNMVTSLILVYRIGLLGVIIGTLLSDVITYITRTYIVFYKYYKQKSSYVIISNMKYLFCLFVQIIVITLFKYFMNSFLPANSIITILVYGIFSIIVYISMVWLLYSNNPNVQWLLGKMKGKVLK